MVCCSGTASTLGKRLDRLDVARLMKTAPAMLEPYSTELSFLKDEY